MFAEASAAKPVVRGGYCVVWIVDDPIGPVDRLVPAEKLALAPTPPLSGLLTGAGVGNAGPGEENPVGPAVDGPVTPRGLPLNELPWKPVGLAGNAAGLGELALGKPPL
jgi:hypothetical protein